MAKLNLSNIGPMNNIIINGNFDIWQRGTSFAAAANGDYTTDRMKYGKVGTMVHTILRSTDVPTVSESGLSSSYSMLTDCTTADASIAAGDLLIQEHRVEGYNFAPLFGNYGTLSFWVKGTKTGIHCVSFINTSSDRSYIAEYTISAADTWEKKTITVNFNETGGTWDLTTGYGLRVSFCLAAGSTYQTTADAWQSGQYFATSNQVNACDSTANNFRLAQVKLEQGQVATPFVGRSIEQELALCQRYYEKSYDVDTVPGSITQTGTKQLRCDGTAVSQPAMGSSFKVRKNSTPTILWWNHSNGASTSIRNDSAGTNFGYSSTTNPSEQYTGYPILNSAPADLDVFRPHWTADAEL